MSANILILPGDGIGPEVIAQAENALRALADAGAIPAPNISYADIGGAAIETAGAPLPDAALTAAQNADAVLLGAVGAPQYDNLPAPQKPEKGLLALRKGMGVFANLRPAVCYELLAGASSLRPELVSGLDILIVRELTGGIYFGEPRGVQTAANGAREAVNTMRYAEDEIARLARAAFTAARRRQKRLCSADKANVLEVGMLWREVFTRIGETEYPDVELSHLYVDNAAMQLVREPKQFDVLAAGNLFGDILSDAAAMLAGSIGMLPSASLNESGRGLYEPVHGSAPALAGKDAANPLAAILSVEMMLRHSLAAPRAADILAAAVQKTLASGARTADIARPGENCIGCREMGKRVAENIAADK
ncbi:MAG: 3-isopropylmalate dehydrogenase [Gammaproteobacteria bacterium]